MSSEKSNTFARKTRILRLGILLFVVVLFIFITTLLMRPQRSVEAYCQTLAEENERLSSKKGDTYAVKVFSETTSDPSDFANSLNKLEKVAPQEIRADIETLKKVFEKIDDDPSQLFAASLSGLTAEENVEKWNIKHCVN